MLTADMTVRDVLRLLLDSSDRYIPLVESRAQPLLLGSVTRAQLLGWFYDVLEYLDEYEDELAEAEAEAEAEAGAGAEAEAEAVAQAETVVNTERRRAPLDDAQLESLFAQAVKQGLAEVDACERMRENVRAGRFTAEHYKQMWRSRFELQDNVRDNAAACSAVATAASASAAAVAADEELPSPAIRSNVMDEVPTQVPTMQLNRTPHCHASPAKPARISSPQLPFVSSRPRSISWDAELPAFPSRVSLSRFSPCQQAGNATLPHPSQLPAIGHAADAFATPFIPDTLAATPTGPAASSPPSTSATRDQVPQSPRKQVSYSTGAACATSPRRRRPSKQSMAEQSEAAMSAAEAGSSSPFASERTSGSPTSRPTHRRNKTWDSSASSRPAAPPHGQAPAPATISRGASSLRRSCLATLASVSIERGTCSIGSSSAQACTPRGASSRTTSRTPRGSDKASSASVTASHLFPRLGEGGSPGESGRWRFRAANADFAGSALVERSAPGWLRTSFQSSKSSSEDLLDFESDGPRPLTCIADAHESSPAGEGAANGVPIAHSVLGSSVGLGVDPVAADDIDEERLAKIVDLHQPFPFDEVDYNRCALQLSSETSLDEIHSLFSFMSMGHVWITAGGTLCGVVSDRLLIEACLPVATAAEA